MKRGTPEAQSGAKPGFSDLSLSENYERGKDKKELSELWILAVKADKPELAEFIENLRKSEAEKKFET